MPAAAASINSFKILGDSFIWIEAGSRARNGVRYGARGDRTLILGDATAIVGQVPLVKSMSPNADGHTQVVYAGENWVTMFRGVTPVFLQIRRWNMKLGAFFTEADVEPQHRSVFSAKRWWTISSATRIPSARQYASTACRAKWSVCCKPKAFQRPDRIRTTLL